MSDDVSAVGWASDPDGELPPDLAGVDPVAFDRIEREERAARLKVAAIEAGRRKGGAVGAVLAGSMLALQEIYEGPPHDADIVEVSESPDEPGDIDKDGIKMTVGHVDVWAPPPVGELDGLPGSGDGEGGVG